MADAHVGSVLQRWCRALGLVVAALGAALPVAAVAPADGAAPVLEITRAERLDTSGAAPKTVTLPDRLEPAAVGATVGARYLVNIDLGAHPQRQALYASGVIGHLRVRLNGELLRDEIADPLPPAPRSLGRLRLVELPDALLRPGSNELELELAGRNGASLSVLRVGDRQALAALRDRKAMAMVIGPALVATVIGCLGAAMLALYLRRRSETVVAYFAGGALLWSLHTFWTVAPQPLLAGDHLTVWWTTLYAALVVLLVLFCLRFAQRWRPDVERVLLVGVVLTAPLLYAASAAGVLASASEALRLMLVLLVFVALAAVAHHAWHRRRIDNALLVAAGLAGAGFGLRDWLVWHSGADNLPVSLTPYAGLPFIVLATALLIDRFVRATERLERLNLRLDEHLARREAELAANFTRVADLERTQAAAGERQRLLRELHDGLGAKLVTAMTRIESGDLDRQGLTRELRALLDDMRLAMETLSPDATDLGAAVGNFLFRWETLLRDAGVCARWDVDLPPGGKPVPPYVALQLLRVMQEALTNVLRHADAREVRLDLRSDGRGIALAVEDDGRGMPPDGSPRGRGIADMRSRAHAIGARFALRAPAGGGTRVELDLELPTRA